MTPKEMTYTYNNEDGNYNVKLRWGRYVQEKQIALKLIDVSDGLEFATASVCIPGVQLSPNEIIVKDYSENVGMLSFLQKNHIVGDVVKMVNSGYVLCPIVEIKEEFLSQIPT